jgi:subtilisin family serine protease
MRTTVNINETTARQLVALLGLSSEEAARVLAGRPYPTRESLTANLPARFAANPPGLDIPLLDINAQTAAQLVSTAGIAQQAADKVVNGRPYFMMQQVSSVVGSAEFQKLLPFYTTPNFQFTDKLTGQQVVLNPDPSEVMISRTNLPQSESLATFRGAARRFGPRSSPIYDVFALPESEDATDVVGSIEQAYGKRAIPAFKDGQSSRRYLNPKYCVVQFQSDVSRQRIWAIMANLGLTLEEAHRTPGLYTVRIAATESNPSALVAALNALNALPEVKLAEPNFLGFSDREESSAGGGAIAAGMPWNFLMSRIPEVWSRTTGSSDVVIAIIDSGVDWSHPAISGALLSPAPGESFNFAAAESPDPGDQEGHGTFIAGVLAGNGQLGIRGICPACRILPLKIPLTGDVNSYAARRDAILFASNKIKPHQKLIINMSWKTTGDIGLIRDACNIAASRDALLIASAGNGPERMNEPHYPSDYPSVVSVAALTPDRKRADYSFYGDRVDVSAAGGDQNDPQKNITSAAPGGTVTSGCGTSFAAPHAAGIAALVASAYPSLTATRLRFCIERGANALTEPGMGTGLCDARNAFELAANAPGSITGRLDDAPVAPPTGPGGSNGTGATNTASTGLQDLNRLDAAALQSKYGLAAITAAILVARRPFAEVAQIRGTLGLTEQQFAAIASGAQGTLPGTGGVTADSGSLGLRDLNTLDAAALASAYGLATITASIIVARRPFTNVTQIQGTLGLTDQQFAAIQRGQHA